MHYHVFSGLSSTGTYFTQVISLSTVPDGFFHITNWTSFVDLIMSLLTNPFFYCIIGIILIMGILPTVED